MKIPNLILGTVGIIVGSWFLVIAVNPPLMTGGPEVNWGDVAIRNFWVNFLPGTAFMVVASILLFLGRAKRVRSQSTKT